MANNDWHKEEDHVVRKPIVSKAPVWKAMALGAGIGLAVTHRILAEHGGSVSLRTDGGGAALTLTLPALHA